MSAAYRNDPRWQDAQTRFVADNADDEAVDAAMARRIIAAKDMHRIELAAEMAA